MEDAIDVKYRQARRGMLKDVIVAWLRAGGQKTDSQAPSSRVYRIWKHAEGQLLAFFGQHKKKATTSNRRAGTHRPKSATWGVRL
jgi:hypothetical protein